MRVRFFVSVVLLMHVVSSNAQFRSPFEDTLNGDVYAAQVKLIDEFISRFNREEVRRDLPDSLNTDYNNLLLLFDFQTFSPQKDSLLFEMQQFARSVLNHSAQIQHDDHKWYADVEVIVSLIGKKMPIHLFLVFEPREKQDMFKWTICGAEGVLFDLQKPLSDLFISPIAHEMEFMEVSGVFKETPKYITSYLPTSHTLDNLSALAVLVANKCLHFESINQIQFVFEQVPGYRFYVSYHARESKNSGWLISQLEHI